MSTTEERLKMLVNAFMRMELKVAEDDQYPIELNDVILKFLGCILFIFDVFNCDYRYCISNNGTVVEGDLCGSQFMAASTISFDKGINEFAIKCIKAMNDVIGICTELKEIENNSPWCCYITNGYMYYGYGALLSSANIKVPTTEGENGEWKWKDDDEIKVVVNCDVWNVTFFKNGEQIGNALKISPNKKYHPFIGCQCDNTKYQICL